MGKREHHLTVAERRAAFRWAYANGLLWSLGNGLASTTLIYYLASEYGAQGLAVGLIFAAPSFIGVLRLGASSILAQLGDRRRFAIGGYMTSGLLLAALPWLTAPGVLPGQNLALASLVVLWSLFHLAEYLATIALWSWLRDLAPGPIRGRFIGRRERWMLVGRIVGMLAAGLFVYGWQRWVTPGERPVFAYQAASFAGGLVMLTALVPLARMPSLPMAEPAVVAHPVASLLAPLADARFRRLLAFGVWFSLVNGLTTYAQYDYAKWNLEFGVLALLGLDCLTRLGQSGTAPFVGRWADRLGNRPVMMAAQVLVALALLFYAAATPEQPWWIAGAWVLWIGYVGLNVCLPNTVLKLAPREAASSYIAMYYALAGLCYGVSSVLGGVLVDQFRGTGALAAWAGDLPLDYHRVLFMGGCVLRIGGVILLARLLEPGARRWVKGLRADVTPS